MPGAGRHGRRRRGGRGGGSGGDGGDALPAYQEALSIGTSDSSRPTSDSRVSESAGPSTWNTNAALPPPYIHTVYDETLRGVWYPYLSIDSMATRANIIGRLEFAAPNSDGSFAICAASGAGNFISKALLDAIPEEKRPVLDEAEAGREVTTLMGSKITTLGSVFFPFLLTNMDTNERMRYILRAFVVPTLLIPMFMGCNRESIIEATAWNAGVPVHTFTCREDTCRVKGC